LIRASNSHESHLSVHEDRPIRHQLWDLRESCRRNQVARAAEAAGFESVWTGEHIVLPDPAIPALLPATKTPMPDTTVALTWIAARTKRLRLASGIILVPLRSPAVLAKELASIYVVSGGHLIIQ